MTTLRRGRETLLTLLEAFVSDPLLDWTSHDTGIIASFYGGGAAREPNAIGVLGPRENRKIVEKRMTCRLFEIRLVESKSMALENEGQLLKLLNRLEVCANGLRDLSGELKEDKEDLIHLYEMAKIYLDESITLHNENSKTKGK